MSTYKGFGFEEPRFQFIAKSVKNIAKSVIRNLTSSGQYSKVRLLDFHAFRPSAYALQRELNAKGIEVDKVLTQNAQALE